MGRLHPRNIRIGVISAAILLFTFSVFSEGLHRNTISRRNAITIAKARVEADGVMSLTQRKPIAHVEGDIWHVTFEWRQSSRHDDIGHALRVGGHPHVFIHKFDGHILQVFYTQ